MQHRKTPYVQNLKPGADNLHSNGLQGKRLVRGHEHPSVTRFGEEEKNQRSPLRAKHAVIAVRSDPPQTYKFPDPLLLLLLL